MNRDQLTVAVEISNRLFELEEARKRLIPGSFKSAILVVEDHAHGNPGMDGRPQVAQSRVLLDRESAHNFVEAQIAAINRQLKELGVD